MSKSRDRAKQAAADAAAMLVRDGMTLGLGSGSTANLFLEALARRIRDDKLQIRGVPTSRGTEAASQRLGIPLVELRAETRIDLAIDGTDEVEAETLSLIKGHGGALLREKLVAVAATRFVVIADSEKLVARLGSRMAVPVEVVVFAHEKTAQRLDALGGKPQLRRDSAGNPFVSDGGNYIYDCSGFAPIEDAAALEIRLSATIGVIESGLFVDLASEALIGDASGAVQRMARR